MNRLIVIPFLTGDRRGIQPDIIDLSCKSFLIDFMSSIYAKTREEEIKIFKEATTDAELLGNQDQRTKQIYRYIFYLNRILGLEVPEKLAEYILENLDMVNELTPDRNPVLDMFMQIMNETKMKPRFHHAPDGTGRIGGLSIACPPDIFSSLLPLRVEAMRQYPNHIKFETNLIQVNFPKDDTGAELFKVMSAVIDTSTPMNLNRFSTL